MWNCSKSVRTARGVPAVPAVPNGLEIAVFVRDLDAGLFGLDKETGVLEIRVQEEGVVGPLAALAHGDAALDLDLLGVGVGLGRVVHVPAEGGPELINEVLAGLLFLVARREVVGLVGVEVGGQFLDLLEGPREGVGGVAHAATMIPGAAAESDGAHPNKEKGEHKVRPYGGRARRAAGAQYPSRLSTTLTRGRPAR